MQVRAKNKGQRTKKGKKRRGGAEIMKVERENEGSQQEWKQRENEGRGN